ncbi:MAG: class I SAM-dependent methyltransferase [Promethearchaeota archaeon]
MRKFDFIKLKLYITFYNRLYNRISQLATKLNNGIHPKHKIMNYHNFFLENIDKNSKVLDIGCGIGYLAYNIAKKAKMVTAIDNNPNIIIKAKSRFNKDNLKFIYADATTYQFNEKYDYIILSNVLEHIKDRKNFLLKIKPLADIFLIRVPMINRSWLPLYFKELGYDYRLDNSHYIEYTLESFKKELKSADYEIIYYSIQFGEIWAKVKPKA